MKLSAATLAFSILCAATAGAQTLFVSVMEDVPLAPGLTETGASLSFTGAEGQILQAEASGAVGAAAVARYYEEALPALGWAPEATPAGADPDARALVYRRGRERLAIDIATPAAGASALKFRLVARQAPPKLD